MKVPKTQLTVEKVDLSEIKQPLLDILGAFQSFEIPEQLPTDLSTVEELLRKSNELLKRLKRSLSVAAEVAVAWSHSKTLLLICQSKFR